MPAMRLSPAAMVLLLLLTLTPAAAPSFAQDAAGRAPAETHGKAHPNPQPRLELATGWKIQSSCTASDGGEKISSSGYEATGWHNTTVPNTTVGSLVDDKTYPDPTYGTNLKSLPGMNYSADSFFANQDLPAGSPFLCSWWWRNEFTLPPSFAKKHVAIHFPGINYRANVWFNGTKVADAKDVAGTFRIFEFDLTTLAKPGARNTIALEIFVPGKNDLGITWVDWNPTPADKDAGIWKEVTLTATGPVAIRNPYVKPDLKDDLSAAEVTVSADLRNDAQVPVKGTFVAEIDGKTVRQAVELGAGETKRVSLGAAQHPELKFAKPKLWWPYTIGTPYLYHAKLAFEADGAVSDATSLRFGVRKVTSELTDKGHRLFKINGRRVLIRGAAWAPDMFLRPMPQKLDADLRYVKHMGLNTIRLEGRIDRDELFNKTDEMGILVMPGWTCCDAWELWQNWTDETRKIAAASMADQARRLRNHASVFVWLYGSDGPPPADVEKMYLSALADAEWPNPSVSSASETPTTVTGKSGVKMTGPYEYVPPVYWLADTQAGGAYGYNTETSPGPAIPTLESLERFIPKEHLWPIDEVWNYHAGGERFTTVNVFTDALTRRYGPAISLADYERKAQAMAYDGERAMFESYGRNKYVSTGVIQWMLNNSWPSLIWHLYDYYLVPGGGYFGTKRAMQPVHVQYGYDDHSVAVVNDTYVERKGMKIRARVFSLDGKTLADKSETVDVPADGAVKAFEVPMPEGVTPTYFVKLNLYDPRGKLVSDNFYWLSTKADTLDWAKRQDTVYTPQAEFGDLSGLQTLKEVKLESSVAIEPAGKAHVRVKNPTSGIAFQVRLRLLNKKDGADIVPVFWDDNYFSLLPGEERIIGVSYDAAMLHAVQPGVEISGFNIVKSTP
ncbi:MAG TPA: hypothetical protein VMT51_09000 [Dongiaceae bacterium]|nr:hypothetical protein [Dongiaceae bacterium]